MDTSISTPQQDRELLVRDLGIVTLLPEQGQWSQHDYLWLTDHTNRLAEYTDGIVEVLPMPTERHQAVVRYLFLAFLSLMQRIGGEVFFAPLRLQVAPRKFREPDLLLLCSADDPRRGNEYWNGADLVAEIVSPDDPDRDYVIKRADYAEAGVAEYWIVDPQREVITVLHLADGNYIEHAAFGRGATVTSVLLPDFRVSVDAVFAVG